MKRRGGRGPSWSEEDDRELEQRWQQGLFDDEIAEAMNRSVNAIKNRRTRKGLTGMSYEQRLYWNTADVVMPQFEDITPEEAYRITRGVKRSAPFSRQPYLPYSRSSAAQFQDQEGAWRRKLPPQIC